MMATPSRIIVSKKGTDISVCSFHDLYGILFKTQQLKGFDKCKERKG